MMETAARITYGIHYNKNPFQIFYGPFKLLITKPIAFYDNKTKGHTN